MLKFAEWLRNKKGMPRLAARIMRIYLSFTPRMFHTSRAYFILGNLFLDIGEIEKAFGAYEVARKFAGFKGDLLMYADIVRKMGYLYLHTEKDLEKAQFWITVSAMNIIKGLLRQQQDNPTLRVAANCYASLGNYHHAAGDREAAKKAYLQAQDFAEKSGFVERVTTVMGDLATIAIEEKDWDKAERLLEEMTRRAEQFYRHALPSSLLRLGRLFNHPENPNRNPGRAEAFFKKSLAVARKSGWKREEADALIELEKYDEAKAIYSAIGYQRQVARLKTPS